MQGDVSLHPLAGRHCGGVHLREFLDILLQETRIAFQFGVACGIGYGEMGAEREMVGGVELPDVLGQGHHVVVCLGLCQSGQRKHKGEERAGEFSHIFR